jgi:uncharacterized protein
MLFIDWETGTRLRLSGETSVDPDDTLMPTYPGAQLVVRVRVREVFANCRRYVHRMQPVERSPFVPSGPRVLTVPPRPDVRSIPAGEVCRTDADCTTDRPR